MRRIAVWTLILTITFFTKVAFSAGYDATGTWDFSITNNWVNPGNAGCIADSDETGTATLNQSGDSFTLVIDGVIRSGNISGATYTSTRSYPDEGGTLTETVTFTLSSTSYGAGNASWYWTDGEYWCEGGSSIYVTRVSDQWPMVYKMVLGELKERNLKVLRGFRDKILANKPAGKRYVKQFYQNSFEVALILLLNPELRVHTAQILEPLIPKIQLIIEGDQIILYQNEVEDIKILLGEFSKEAGPRLSALIFKVKKDLDKEKILAGFGIILE